jgi:hypothetical protein
MTFNLYQVYLANENQLNHPKLVILQFVSHSNHVPQHINMDLIEAKILFCSFFLLHRLVYKKRKHIYEGGIVSNVCATSFSHPNLAFP